MTKPPQVNGLILCDRVRVETAPPSFNLDGLFLAREFDAFPTAPVAFDIYASLFDGRGEGKMELTCMRLVGEAKVYYYKKWIAFTREIPMAHCIVPVRKLTFPSAGRYALTLLFDDEPAAVRFLDVRKVRK